MSVSAFSSRSGNSGSQGETVVDRLEHWVERQPDKCLYSFLDVEGNERDTYTYLGFHERTRDLAEHLSLQAGLKRGDRVLLVYPPGLEFIVAFLACVRVGVIPVPVYPPTPMHFELGLSKLTYVSRDCGVRAALTTRGFYRSYTLLMAKRKISSLWQKTPALPKLRWVTTDDVRGQASDAFRNDPHPTFLLQYTSGSTSDPKGVIVSHENILHNGDSILDHSPTMVSWLPVYHDMGLIGYYLYPIVGGGTTYGFSPLDFLKRPALWLQTISKVRATFTSSPNFGYEYCLREDKLPSEELEGLDLGSMRVMMNASEPVRADTYTRFLERFAPYGLRPEAHIVAYGLAENTLCVSNMGKKILTTNKKQLQQRKLHIEDPQPRNNNQLHLLSCGKPLDGVHVKIVDPDSCTALGENRIGEIWMTGESTCEGYWERPDLTEEVFGGRIAGDPEDRRPYLRTGDLGFYHEGEVFVCGRIKDLIIIRGVNFYPQDIECIVEATSPRIRTGGVAAFDLEEEGEGLVVMAEVRKAQNLPDHLEIARAIRSQYYVEPHTIVFVPPRTIVKTTSGKIARSATRRAWLNGELAAIATHVSSRELEPAGDMSGIRERFQYIVELYNLTGREDYSFAEIGIDSLMMVRLLADIKDLLEEHGAGGLVDEVDVRLLQRLTIAEFFALIDQLGTVSDQPLAALRYVLKRIQKEHESYERDCMRSDAELEPLTGRIQVSTATEPFQNVLLTGATGFFGPFLLNSLLSQTPYTFYALTRATDPVHGMDRIRASLRKSRLWTPSLEEQLETRVHVVCGDVSRHNLGMRSEQWKSLATQVQAVCHNAALVNYVLSYDAMRPHNVDGTRELLRFAFTGRKKEFHLVSSTFIFGWTAKDIVWETDNNPDMENLDFGYSQTKWVAEQLVLAAEKQGLDVRLYRPSLISPSTNGVGNTDDIFIRMLAFILKYGAAVSTENQISLLPADYTAHHIAATFNQRETTARTFHLTVDDYYNMMDITRLISRNYGYKLTYYDLAGWVGQMNRLLTKDDLLYPLLDFFNRSHVKLTKMQHKRYNNERFQEVRGSNGRPEPRLEEVVSHLMDYLLAEGVIPAAPGRRAAEASARRQDAQRNAT